MTKPRSVAATANDNAIPGSRLEDESVEGSKIKPGDISNSLLSIDAVDTVNIKDGAVDSSKLSGTIEANPIDGSVTDAKVSPTAAISATKLSYSAPYGTSPVTRDARSKFSDVASVLDFGADPTGTQDSTQAIQNCINSGKHAFVPAGSYRVDGMITMGNSQSLELGQRAGLRRDPAYTDNTDPVVWIRGSNVNLFGPGQGGAGLSSGNRAPYGILRIGFANMQYNPVPQPNVTYNSIHGFNIGGSTSGGPTTLDPVTGQPDSCIFICNPQFFSRAVYFQTIYDMRLSNSNIGLWLCGWANANLIDMIHGYRLGNTATAPYNCFIYDNGGLDNTISNVFFHQSSGSTGLRVEKYDNTSQGGAVHSNYASSYRGMVFEQGGPAKGVIALDSERSFYEVRHNVSQGNTFSSNFFDRNFWFGLGSNNGLLDPTYGQYRRLSRDTSTNTSQVAYEEYFSTQSLTEATAYSIGNVTLSNNQNGAMVEVEFGNGARSGINYQGGGKFLFVIKRNSSQIISSTVLMSRYSSGVVPQEPIASASPGGGVEIIFRVNNNGTGISGFALQGVVRVVGGAASINLNSTATVYSGATVALSPTL